MRHVVLKSCHGRLRRECHFARQTATAHLQHAVIAQGVTVIGILITGCYLEDTLGHHLLDAVHKQAFVTPLTDMGTQTMDEFLMLINSLE
jgi:hypothetical protein